jgi:flagellar motor switch/type III secretory pathway protein FliN
MAALAESLGELLGGEVSLLVRDVRAEAEWPPKAGIWLEVVDGGSIGVDIDPDLIVLALSRVLKRPPNWSRSDSKLDATLAGALGALVLEAARRSGHLLPFRLRYGTPASQPVVAPLRVAITLLFDERPYAVDLTLCPAANANVEQTAEPADLVLERLGSLPVSVPIVVALAACPRAALEAMGPGDAWLPGDGWWIQKEAVGRAALAAPNAERGIAVELTSDGSLVLSDETVSLAHDAATASSVGMTMQRENERDGQEPSIADTVLDAPIVVRVELGAVAMTAREWAELRPGDVIETGRRVAEPVILRIAGHEVAQGDLVNIEGELGVRIRRLSRP